MANGLAATMTQIRGLLSGKILPAARALNAGLADYTEICRGTPDEVPEEVGPAFVVEHTGSAPDESAMRSNVLITQRELFSVHLSVHLGGGEGAGRDFSQAQQELGELTTRALDLLEDPNNGNRDDTGWWWTPKIKPTKPRQANGRLIKTLEMECMVAHEAGPF